MIWHVHKENNIQVVIQGPNPSLLFKEIESALRDLSATHYTKLELEFDYLCPICIVEAVNSHPGKFCELPKEVRSRIDKGTLIKSDAVISCSSKHKLRKNHVMNGFSPENPQSVIAQLRKYAEKGRNINHIPRAEFIENRELLRLIMPHYYTFAERFDETRLIIDDITAANYSERPVMILNILSHAREIPSIETFIEQLQDVTSMYK